MPHLLPWSEFEYWFDLLDSLCIDQEHFDNNRLAGDLATLTKSNGEAGYETALRNLANWRRGRHLPHRKNFIALSTLLDVDGYDGLKPHWNRLYSQAKGHRNGPARLGLDAASGERLRPFGWVASRFATHPKPLISLLVGVVVLLSGVAYFGGAGLFEGAEADFQIATIRHKIYVSPKIGESVVIHGVRGDCGAEPPKWEDIAPGFPVLKTGILSEGDLGVRFSRACGGNTPARAVVFTATRPGKERITLFGDTTTIEVK